MIGLGVKSAFFDRKAVMDAVGKARLKVLKEFGRLVRKGAQKSLVYADGVSSPGSPPHAHKTRSITRTSRSTGKTRRRTVSPLREFLFFSYDAASRSVVIGPERTGGTVDPGSLPALEFGGTATVLSFGVRKNVRIRPRPFMGPALDAERPGFPGMWADSVR